MAGNYKSANMYLLPLHLNETDAFKNEVELVISRNKTTD